MIQQPQLTKKDEVDNNLKNSKWHTLFETQIKESKEPITINDEELFRVIPPHTQYRMFIDYFLESERGLHSIFNTLWNAEENDTLELRIHSFGGIIKEGQMFYNLIKNKFIGRTTTVLDGS